MIVLNPTKLKADFYRMTVCYVLYFATYNLLYFLKLSYLNYFFITLNSFLGSFLSKQADTLRKLKEFRIYSGFFGKATLERNEWSYLLTLKLLILFKNTYQMCWPKSWSTLFLKSRILLKIRIFKNYSYIWWKPFEFCDILYHTIPISDIALTWIKDFSKVFIRRFTWI